MTWRAAVWSVALAISLAVHAMLALSVSGLRGAAPGVALAELRIADDAGFAVTVVRPVAQPVQPAAQPSEADIRSTDAIKPVAPMVLAPAANTADQAGYGAETQGDEVAVAAVAAEQLEAAGSEKPLSPVASGGAIQPAAQGESLAGAVEPIVTEQQPAAEVPAVVVAVEQLEAAGPGKPLSPVASVGAIPSTAQEESMTDAVHAAAAALEPVSPQPAGAVEPMVTEKQAAAAAVPAAAVAAEQLEAAEPEKPLSPVTSGGAIPPAAPGESLSETVVATATALEPVAPLSGAPASSAGAVEPIVPESQVAAAVKPVASETPAPPGTVPSAALPGVAAEKLAPVPQQVALAPAALAPASLAERMRNFVRFYDGGACFFAVPVAFDGQRPRIDGFGSDAGPILTFGVELRRALGIDAEIVVRQITGEQCPAIGFIGGLLKSRLPELLVQLASDRIASGQELRGTVDRVHLPWLSLLLVDDDGMVHDISSYLSKTQVEWSFAAPLYVTAQGRERNQLIVAIAASRALDRLTLTRPTAGSELFPAVVDEANCTQNDIAIGIGAFRVE
ncbi:MAG: hypothetical protein ACT4SY_06345 [Hyphomicrobiales bacterium]